MVTQAAILSTTAPDPPRVRAGGEFPDAEFVVIPDVPIFAEHETKGRNGRKLKFGREELQAVADRCNRRISETGDYAAVTLGHTPEPGEGEQPQVVGFAGPFKLGRLSGGKTAILADFHIFRGDEDMLKRYPRRSPELWLEDSYYEMFLDPIALLGAEAPRLDMGLLYSAERNGRLVEKYAAVAPAAGNVFIPSGSIDDDQPKEYAAGDKKPMELTPEALQQVVEALDNLDWVKAIKGQLNANQGNNAVAPMPQPIPGQPGPNPADQGGMPPEMNPAAGLPGEGEIPDLDLEPEADNTENEAMPDDDRTKIEDDVTPEVPEVLDEEDDEEDEDKEKYSKVLQSLRQDAAKLKAENEQLRSVIKAETEQRINAERYGKLADIRKTRCFDMDKETRRCRYARKGGMSDEQFTAHIESISENYRPIPIGEQHLPTHGAGAMDPMHREHYSKEHSDKALKIAEAKRLAGEKVDYLAVLEEVTSGKA